MRKDIYEELSLYSDETQEVLGGIPSRIHRIGLYSLAILVATLLVGGYVFRYPDIILAEIKITPSNIVQPLVAPNSGYIVHLHVPNGTKVYAGSIIAEIGSSTLGRDALSVEQYTNVVKAHLLKGHKILALDSLPPKLLSLGRLENSHQAFLQSINRLILFEKQNYYPLRIKAQKMLNFMSTQLVKEAIHQRKISMERSNLSELQLRRDSLLWKKGLISEEAYEQARSSTLAQHGSWSSAISLETQSRRQSMEGEIGLFELEQKYKETEEELRSAILTSADALLAEISSWREAYLLTAKTEGKLLYWGNHYEQQYVTAGEKLFTVRSATRQEALGILTLSAQGAGKIEIGQRVIIRLNNYPDTEYGLLEAKVRYLSPNADEKGFYLAEVYFPKGLKTSYGEVLSNEVELSGVAEVITQDKRLIERIFSPIYKLFHQNT